MECCDCIPPHQPNLEAAFTDLEFAHMAAVEKGQITLAEQINGDMVNLLENHPGLQIHQTRDRNNNNFVGELPSSPEPRQGD